MSNPVVKIKQGSLKGKIVETEFGQVLTFSGIPFAEPPVGELRFKDPQPLKSWDGIRDAIKEAGISAQYDSSSGIFMGGDDCLYLNVSTKYILGKKPVMIWIHGGGFKSGSGNSDIYRSDYFVKHGIVFVSINYRLGILGFLNLDMENCSGNQGLKDQVLALKWVQENIEAFGGDKNNVTIFGESAGAACVYYHCISPLAKGLFHKAIAQSGVCTNPWAFHTSNKEKAMKVAAALGCSSSNNEEILSFLSNIPVENILKTQSRVFDEHPLKSEFHFVPTMDKECPNPFLPQPLSELIKKEVDVPLIIGYTSHEGIITLANPEFKEGKGFKKLDENFEHCFSKELNVDLKMGALISKEVRNFYFGKNPITKEQQDNYIQYIGDLNFVAGIWHLLEKHMQKKAPIYLYKFSYSPEVSFMDWFFNIHVKGASHAIDLTYMFYKKALPQNMQLQKGTLDYLVMQRLTKIWTNFAKTGDPTPMTNDELINVKWSPYNSDKKCCLHINDELKTEDNFAENSWNNLWKSIYQKYMPF